MAMKIELWKILKKKKSLHNFDLSSAVDIRDRKG